MHTMRQLGGNATIETLHGATLRFQSRVKVHRSPNLSLRMLGLCERVENHAHQNNLQLITIHLKRKKEVRIVKIDGNIVS